MTSEGEAGMHPSLGSNVEVVDFLGLDENERERRPELRIQVNIETCPTARGGERCIYISIRHYHG